MENPHAERQAVLLERIVKNTEKCTEAILELNHCMEEILRANAYVKTAADLSVKYRKNVQYNLEATKGLKELDASKFKASRSQRKLVNRWNRFVEHGKGQDASKNAKQKGKNTTDFDLIEHIHASEHYLGSEKNGWAHRFEIVLEASSYTEEKYELFSKYQTNIHHDKSTRSGFKHFLVESPLRLEPIPYPSPPDPQSRLPTHYGSYHQLYRLDGKLIAMAVLDILPSCVSSVYFMYDDSWDEFSLGKISALREISLANELFSAKAPGLKFLYLGPPDDDTEEFDSYSPSEPGPELMSQLLAVDRIAGPQLSVKSLDDSMPSGAEREELLCCIEGLGIPLAKKMIFYLR
ncbi:Arginyl-tRNA--protein transferase 1 [Marasmius crinis-equi]|uniref:Arginyl-tRNA--protein transferase 1 n=1 Tax=Marasmius crinis-equi TaxID=585013 RepID=A0ABR3G2H9_9AGAR